MFQIIQDASCLHWSLYIARNYFSGGAMCPIGLLFFSLSRNFIMYMYVETSISSEVLQMYAFAQR